MAVVHRTNNRILPANARAVDVAKNALVKVADVQQARYHNAFAVDGRKSLYYSMIEQGVPCSCVARDRAVNTRLDPEGRMSAADMNELVTDVKFGVRPYASREADTPGYIAEQQARPVEDQEFFNISSRADTSFLESLFNGSEESAPPPFTRLARNDNDDPGAQEVDPDGGVGVNGPVQSSELRQTEFEHPMWDLDAMGLTEVSCPICFGSGFIGGFEVLGGWRKVLVPQQADFVSDGVIEPVEKPIVLRNGMSARWLVTLPCGAWTIDALNVWNRNVKVPATFFVDHTSIQSERDFLSHCNGRQTTIDVVFTEPTDFTHLEIQLGLSKEPTLIEFPKLAQNSDLTKLDNTDDVGILASPLVPRVNRKDILFEMTFGKFFQVTGVTPWNDQQRRLHGWEMQARVVQPMELFALLPKRLVNKQPTVVRVGDNSRGERRT